MSGPEIRVVPQMGVYGVIELITLDPQTGRIEGEQVLTNLVVDNSFKIIPAVLGRDTNKQIEFISIGTGGDFAEQPSGPPVDTGTRNPPAETDTSNRIELFRAPIRAVDLPALNSVRYFAILEADESNSTSIDEFALLSSDATCFSHAVNEAAVGSPFRTVKLTKNTGLIVVVQWTISFFRCDGDASPIIVTGAGGNPVTISPPIP